MKVRVNSKKGLKASLSVLVDKKTIQKKLDEKLIELQSKVQLKGFRPGKVPPTVIKNQFGKAIYGEVIDGILKETSTKAIEDNKIKVAGQPKIDLKTFGEGKDLDYTIELDILPDIKLNSLEKIKATNYEIEVENELVEKRLKEIAKNQQNFSEKKEGEKSNLEDLVVFDYTAKVEGKSFEGNEGKNIQLVLGKDLFIKGFDNQLVGVKKNQNKSVTVKLPENYPNKELANKKADFNCKVINIKKPIDVKIDDELGKKLGAKDLSDLKNLIKTQIKNQYQSTLETITKKKILEQIEKSHNIELPENLVEQETKIITQNFKKEEIEKNKKEHVKLAKARIKTGLILNEIGLKNNLKINESEIKNEIEKQIKSMPGQEKMVMEYYQKNPSAMASLRGALYEDKVIELIKTKIKLEKKTIKTKEAEEILKKISEDSKVSKSSDAKKQQKKTKITKKK
tara:strand:- start:846 stop:2207 length:1362 start_codon:yes stop_codon:yes gene_type:complete